MKKLIVKFASIATLAAAAAIMSVGPAGAQTPEECACYSACGSQTNSCHAGCGPNGACHNSCVSQFNACMAACEDD